MKRQHSSYLLGISLFIIVGALCGSTISCAVGSGQRPAKSIRVLIVGGGSSHNFDMWYKNTDAKLLEKDMLATVRYTNNTDSISSYLPYTDVLFLANNQPVNNLKVRRSIFEFVNAGNGLILAHPALWYNWNDWPEYNLQLVSGGSKGHDRYADFQVNRIHPNHPVIKGVEEQFTLKDERYHYLPDPNGPGIEVLANASVAGSDKIYPSVFVVKHPKSRIVGIALGHDAESHNNPNYQILLRNALKWVARK